MIQAETAEEHSSSVKTEGHKQQDIVYVIVPAEAHSPKEDRIGRAQAVNHHSQREKVSVSKPCHDDRLPPGTGGASAKCLVLPKWGASEIVPGGMRTTDDTARHSHSQMSCRLQVTGCRLKAARAEMSARARENLRCAHLPGCFAERVTGYLPGIVVGVGPFRIWVLAAVAVMGPFSIKLLAVAETIAVAGDVP
jgi:hypothetical protein